MKPELLTHWLIKNGHPLENVEIRDDRDGNGPYVHRWDLEVAQPSNAELEALQGEYDMAKVRRQRDALLDESDKFALADRITPEWEAYRQALRDIPQTYTNVDDVVWPTKPE